MDLLDESKFRFYSIGIVAEDKERKSDFIKVWPSEVLPQTNGNILEHKNDYKVNTMDHRGVKSMNKVQGQSVMVARWVPLSNSNRMTSPDVIKNETVMIYRYADTDNYYWTTIYREPKIRRLETVCYAFGNLRQPLTEWNKDSSYWIEISTHDKYIHLRTTRSDGEPYQYDFHLDTRRGNFIFTDNSGNFVSLDSPTSTIRCETNEAIQAKTKRIEYECETMVVKASASITFDTPIVTNTGEEETALVSRANPHVNCVC